MLPHHSTRLYNYENQCGELNVSSCIRGTNDNQRQTEFNENEPLRDDVKTTILGLYNKGTHYFILITYWTTAEMANAITQELPPFYNTFSQTIGDILRVQRAQVGI